MKKSNFIFAIVAAAALIILGVFFSKKKQKSSLAYKYEISFTSDAVKQRLEATQSELDGLFQKNDLEVKQILVKAGTRLPWETVNFDFSMNNTLTLAMQRTSGSNLIPLLWEKNCNFSAIALIPENSTLAMKDMKNKKIVSFGTNFNSPIVLQAIKDWGLQKANIMFTPNEALAVDLLTQGKVDMVLSEARTATGSIEKISLAAGSKYKKFKIRELLSTDYEIPCRTIYTTSHMPKADQQKFIKTVKSAMTAPYPSFSEVDLEQFKKIESIFNWKELELINRSITSVPKE